MTINIAPLGLFRDLENARNVYILKWHENAPLYLGTGIYISNLTSKYNVFALIALRCASCVQNLYPRWQHCRDFRCCPNGFELVGGPVPTAQHWLTLPTLALASDANFVWAYVQELKEIESGKPFA